MKHTIIHRAGSILLFTFFFAVNGHTQNSAITGSWKGDIRMDHLQLHLVFFIEQNEDGYSSSMDSPDQLQSGIPIEETQFDSLSGQLQLRSLNLMMTYSGILHHDTITGTFMQAGKKSPLTLVRQKRPQDPGKPYPYHSEEVRFDNKEAGISLAGTFTYPETGEKFPAVVLITGSGAQNRDEELLDHRPFLVLSDYLTRNGIAVLRYDDRGVYESEGDFIHSDIYDFASDAMAGFDYLKSRRETDPDKIGIIGHSEGGTISFMLAGEHPEIAFIVSMAGGAVPGDTLLVAQRYAISKSIGLSDKAIMENERLVAGLDSIARRHSFATILQDADSLVEELIPVKQRKNSPVRKFYASQLTGIASPPLRSFLDYDPLDALKKIECSVLALYGEKDLQVPAGLNSARLHSLNKPNFTVRIYPELNHIFQHAKTGHPSEYSSIEETIAPEVLEDIVRWIVSVTARNSR